MTIAAIILIILLYRAYLYYRKHYDKPAWAESKRIYMNEFYTQHFYYYSLLTLEERIAFVSRSLNTLKNLEFISTDNSLISENVKLLIAAAFTQITFGYDEDVLENFNKIFIHPSIFHSRWVGRDVKGLTFQNGRIDWSWEDFVNGYMYHDDKINLALHELAHAFQIELFENQDTDSPEYYAWIAFANIEIERMRLNPEQAYFRAYAATNVHEFFAVSVEYFFEDALTFRQKLPQLYIATAKVLMQDMAVRLERKLIPGEPVN